MNKMNAFLVIFQLFLLCQMAIIRAELIETITKLSYYNLKKIVTKFPVVLIKFDQNYPIDGELHQEYRQLVNDTRMNDEIFVGQFIVPYSTFNDDNESNDRKFVEESQLAKSLNISSHSDLPAIWLYTKGNFDNPLKFSNRKFDSYELRQFVRMNTYELDLRLPTKFDAEIDEFFSEKNDENRRKIFEKLSKENHENLGKYLLKLIERILNDPDHHVIIKNEFKRLKNLLANRSKISDSNRLKIRDELNIVDRIRSYYGDEIPSNDKDEL